MLVSGCFQIGMNMSGNSDDVHCPFGGHSMVICQMNPLEHIQEWQSVFTVLPPENILLAIFALLAFLFVRKTYSKYSVLKPPLLLSSNRLIYLQSFHIFDPFKESFSSGILNPKLF
jgi:hypothetical protein